MFVQNLDQVQRDSGPVFDISFYSPFYSAGNMDYVLVRNVSFAINQKGDKFFGLETFSLITDRGICPRKKMSPVIGWRLCCSHCLE